MTRNELAQTINQSIEKLGFARVARPAILDVFSTGEAVSFDIHDELEMFAVSQNLEFQDDENFVVFYPVGDEPPTTAL